MFVAQKTFDDLGHYTAKNARKRKKTQKSAKIQKSQKLVLKHPFIWFPEGMQVPPVC